MAEIVVEGVGVVERPGERAELSAQFDVVAPTREDAVDRLGARLSALDEPTLAAAIRRRSLWVHEQWTEQKTSAGFAATQSVTLRVEADGLDAVVAGLVAAGPSSLHGPSWSLADTAAARREAQALAVADARERAEGYAAALGVTLGALVRLTEAVGPGHEGRAMGLAFRTAAPDVTALRLEPEPVQVTARCSLTWTTA